MPLNRDDDVADGIPLEIVKCPLWLEFGIAAMSEEILSASQTVGPTLTAEEFSLWLKSQFPPTGD
ncbi:hypothetical protein LC612_29440 [Nostoc sp. CHAB 5834]|nr:hypothetical protein [Nostoc sp. CHAB 5834]